MRSRKPSAKRLPVAPVAGRASRARVGPCDRATCGTPGTARRSTTAASTIDTSSTSPSTSHMRGHSSPPRRMKTLWPGLACVRYSGYVRQPNQNQSRDARQRPPAQGEEQQHDTHAEDDRDHRELRFKRGRVRVLVLVLQRPVHRQRDTGGKRDQPTCVRAARADQVQEAAAGEQRSVHRHHYRIEPVRDLDPHRDGGDGEPERQQVSTRFICRVTMTSHVSA